MLNSVSYMYHVECSWIEKGSIPYIQQVAISFNNKSCNVFSSTMLNSMSIFFPFFCQTVFYKFCEKKLGRNVVNMYLPPH